VGFDGFVGIKAYLAILFSPHVSTIHTVFSKFAELGSARQVWLWFHSEGLTFPLRSSMKSAIRWVAATYHTIHRAVRLLP
jgi:hypothetical protein